MSATLLAPTLYIATSFSREDDVRRLHNAIQEVAPAVQILDWTTLEKPSSIPPPTMVQPERNPYVEKSFFSFCAEACRSADLVICYWDSRPETSVQVGIAYGAGTPVLGIRSRQEAVTPMLASCLDCWLDNSHAVPALIAKLAKCWQELDSVSSIKKCDACALHPICQIYNL